MAAETDRKSSSAATQHYADSLKLLYNMYDGSATSRQDKILEQLYDLAVRNSDFSSVSKVLKLSSDHYSNNNSMQHTLADRAQMLPDSPEKQSTLVYLNTKAGANKARTLTDAEREARLRQLLALHAKSDNYDFYERIEYLFQLCTYLNMSTDGELLTDYFQELQTQIDSLPETDLSLRHLFYNQAANAYASNDRIPEAIDANKTLLNIISEQEKQNSVLGFKSDLLDRDLLECYNSLLRYADHLSTDEIEEYYKSTSDLANRLHSTHSSPDLLVKPTIYYMMANKRYTDAIPLIKGQLADSVTNTDEERFYLIEALVKATEAAGNKDDLLMALEMSSNLLRERIEHKAAESYKELQIVYEVNELQKTNDELMLENQQIIINHHKAQLTYSIISILVLIVLLITVFILYRRSKRLTTNLTQANKLIIDERDTLKRAQKNLIEARDKVKEGNRIKSEFINNMGHEIKTPLESIVEYSALIAECAETDGDEHIKPYADVITLNTNRLLTLVNDVLELPSLENAKAGIEIAKSSLQEICLAAIDNIRDYIKPDIDLIFANDGQPDTTIMTDPNRIEQILFNLLMNAAKFTEKGSIVLKYTISPTHDKVTFTVTDTGIGIPEGREDSIFSRFDKSGNTTKGDRLNLYISRLLANILGGSLTLDNNYRTGAKFIFTVPIS